MLGGKVYATLIIGVVLFMFGGIPHVRGETILLKPEFIEVIKPEFMEVSEFEFVEQANEAAFALLSIARLLMKTPK